MNPAELLRGLGYPAPHYLFIFSQVVERLIALELTSMLIWVLAENPACRFYEKLGGNLVETGVYQIQGRELQQVGYGWPDITQIKR